MRYTGPGADDDGPPGAPRERGAPRGRPRRFCPRPVRHLTLRSVEIGRTPEDGRYDVTKLSGVSAYPGPGGALWGAVFALVGGAADRRALRGDARADRVPFGDFLQDADPEGDFPPLDGRELGELYAERIAHLKGEGYLAERLMESGADGDATDALVELRLMAAICRAYASALEGAPAKAGAPTVAATPELLRLSDLRAGYEAAAGMAGRFVEERWAEIEAVGAALLERRHLDGDEVAEIAGGVVARGGPD